MAELYSYELPNQRTTRDEKREPSFYRSTYNNIISRALSQNNKSDIKAWLEAANGIIDNGTITYLTTPIIDEQTKSEIGKLPGEIRSTDLINMVRERNYGEYIGLPYRFDVNVSDAQAVMNKDAKIKREVDAYIQQAIINELNDLYEQKSASGEEGLNLNAPSEELPNFKEHIEKVVKEYFDDRAIRGQALLELINNLNNFDIHRVQCFHYWWSCEEFYTLREIQNGEVKVEAISPLDGYPILGANTQFIEDAEAFVIRRQTTLGAVKARFWNRMSKSEQDYINSLVNNKGIYTATPTLLQSRTSLGAEKGDYYRNMFNTYNVTGSNELFDEYIVFWRTEVPIKIKTYTDPLGEEFEEIVEDDYDPIEGETVRDEWVEEVWCGRRFGNATVGVYLEPEPIAVQRYDESTNRCKLPVGGKKGILRDIAQNPVPKRLITYELIDRIFGLHIERTLAKYQPYINLIPQSMINDDESGTSSQKLFTIKADNTLFYNDQLVDFNIVAQGFRTVGMAPIADYIKFLYDVKQQYREEGLQMANMNNYRLGDIAPSTGKGVMQEGIARAAVGNVLSITMFNAALERDHNADLEFAKVAYVTGVKRSFYSNNLHKVIYLDVDPLELLDTKYGVFVHNAKIDFNKIEAYRNFAFSAAQNGEFELAANAIESDTLPEIRNAVSKIVEAKRKLDKQLADQQDAATRYAADRAAETANAELEAKKEIAFNHDNAIIAAAQIQAMKGSEGANSTPAPYNYNNDISKIVQSFQKDRELYMKKQMHDDVMKDHDKERKSKEKIANTNKNKYDKKK